MIYACNGMKWKGISCNKYQEELKNIMTQSIYKFFFWNLEFLALLMINTLPLSVPGHLNLTVLMMMMTMPMVGSRWKSGVNVGPPDSVHYLWVCWQGIILRVYYCGSHGIGDYRFSSPSIGRAKFLITCHLKRRKTDTRRAFVKYLLN